MPESIVIGPDALYMLRQVGPTAWTVLCALAIDAEHTDDRPPVRASVRSLAAELGVDKDTVARALVQLRHEHLVIAVANRFEPGAYRLTIPAGVIRFDQTSRLLHGRRHARPHGMPVVQLALLDAD